MNNEQEYLLHSDELYDALYDTMSYADWMSMYNIDHARYYKSDEMRDVRDTYLMWLSDMVDEIWDYKANRFAPTDQPPGSNNKIHVPYMDWLYSQMATYCTENSNYIKEQALDYDKFVTIFTEVYRVLQVRLLPYGDPERQLSR